MRSVLSSLFLLFCSLGAIVVQKAVAQGTPENNQVKIWYQALQWIYEDNNKTVGKNAQKSVPQVSTESLAQFEKGLATAARNKQDEYNFYTRLYQPVQTKLTKEKAVSDEVLINAIVAEAGSKPDRKTENLRLALETVAQKSSTNPENLSPETPANPEVEIANREPENAPAPAVVSSTDKPEKADINMTFIISIAALLLAAFALLRSSRKSSPAVASAKIPENPVASNGSNGQGSTQLKALKRDIENLRKSYQQLKLENENWRSEMQNAMQDLQKSAYAAQPVLEKYDLNTERTTSHFQAEPEPNFSASEDSYAVDTDYLLEEETQPLNQVKYARVPEDGLLKDKDLHFDSRDAWSFIEVHLRDAQSNSATFRINPHVNHALAINNSLDRLENAFEFARSANKATQIINDVDGELVRTAQGWQITKRAKIHLA